VILAPLLPSLTSEHPVVQLLAGVCVGGGGGVDTVGAWVLARICAANKERASWQCLPGSLASALTVTGSGGGKGLVDGRESTRASDRARRGGGCGDAGESQASMRATTTTMLSSAVFHHRGVVTAFSHPRCLLQLSVDLQMKTYSRLTG